jgi:outer membrane protein assembly factor BamB
MVGLDIASGNIVWEHKPEKTGGKEYSEPVCGRRTVYFTDPFGMLFALDIETGKERWKTQLQDVRDLQLAYMDDKVVAATGTQVIFVNAVTWKHLQIRCVDCLQAQIQSI